MADTSPRRTAPRGHNDDAYREPLRLRNLRRMVTLLTGTLILGVALIVVVLVVRLAETPGPIALPDAVQVPDGESVQAVTLGREWIALVTRDADGLERIRVLDRTTGRERALIQIAPAP